MLMLSIVLFITIFPPLMIYLSSLLTDIFINSTFSLKSEFADRFNFFILIGLLILSLFLSLDTFKKFILIDSKSKYLKGIFSISIVIAFSYIFFKNDWLKDSDVTLFWNGYNNRYIPYFIMIYITIFAIKWFRIKDTINTRKLVKFVGIILIFYYLPNLIQLISSEFDNYHFLFTINEIAAISSDFLPPFNYRSQYSNLFGVPLYLATLILNTIYIYYVYFIFLNILCFVIIFYLLKSYSKNSYFILFILTLPTIFVRGDKVDENIGSILTFPGSFPLRILPLLILAVFLLLKIRESRNQVLLNLSIFVVCFLLIINNAETGIVGTISFLIAMLFFKKFRYVLKFSSYLLVFLISCGIMLTFISNFIFGINWFENWLFFVLRFGRGFYSLPSDIFGFHNLIFGLSIAAIILARLNLKLSRHYYESHILTIYFSSVIIFTSPYYFNRSSYTGQLQFIYVLSVFILIYFYVNLRQKSLIFNNYFSRLTFYSFITTILVFPVVQSPNFISNISRIKDSTIGISRLDNLVTKIENFQKLNSLNSDRIGLVVYEGNLVSTISKYRSVLSQNTVDDMVPSYVDGKSKFNNFSCNFIKDLDVSYLVLEKYTGILGQYKNNFVIIEMCKLDLDFVGFLDANHNFQIFKSKSIKLIS